MIRYITRHGQVANAKFIGGDAMFPAGEPPLSELGREQAKMLGERLRAQNFHGKIISSPYLRTLETANIIAEVTDTYVYPYAPIREIFKTQAQADKYRGSTIEEIRERFSRIAPDAALPYPWWEPVEETGEMVKARVWPGYLCMSEKYKNEELLFVGHGASASGLVGLLGIKADRRSTLYNCSLSAVDPRDPGFKPFRFDTAHMPYEKTTSNFVCREETDAEFFAKPFEGDIALPDLTAFTGERILHIGDTHSDHYPYYRALIERVKPDVILHTGDMADEVKVGRIPGTRYEYLSKIRVLLDIMKSSGARLIIVPGNNDLPDEIARIAPEAEIYPVNTEITLSGVPCRIGHQVAKMTFDKPYALYGHGLTGETWQYERNDGAEHRRFNVMWGSFVYDLAHGRYARVPLPGQR